MKRILKAYCKFARGQVSAAFVRKSFIHLFQEISVRSLHNNIQIGNIGYVSYVTGQRMHYRSHHCLGALPFIDTHCAFHVACSCPLIYWDFPDQSGQYLAELKHLDMRQGRKVVISPRGQAREKHLNKGVLKVYSCYERGCRKKAQKFTR